MTRPDREGGDLKERAEDAEIASLAQGLALDRPVALVGLMGAGKSTVGRRLAAALNLPFVDADAEIENAAGMSVQDIFAQFGEDYFRQGERRVIERLLNEPPHVLATGGGAFIDPSTRALMREKAISVWLRADLDVLMRRVERRDDRPLLKGDNPRGVMRKLMDIRYPIYGEADVIVDSSPGPHAASVLAVLRGLRAKLTPEPHQS